MDFIAIPRPKRGKTKQTTNSRGIPSNLIATSFLSGKLPTDSLIERLTDRLVVRGNEAHLLEDELFLLANKAARLFMKDALCMEIKLDEPLTIVGDLYGQHGRLVEIFQKLGNPSEHRYLFLGNYVNRGPRSMELVALLFAYKVKYPNNILMLRGNHECHYVSYYYGFLRECRKRFSQNLWETIVNAFNCLPVAAIVEDIIFCVHSGLIRDVPFTTGNSRTQLLRYLTTSIDRPTVIWNNPVLRQLTWSEPMYDSIGWKRNPCGMGYLFGEEQVTEFCNLFGFEQVIRSNEVMKTGYEFSANGRLLTICSMPNLGRGGRNLGSVVQLRVSQREQIIIGRIKIIELVSQLRTGRPNLVTMIIRDSLGQEDIETEECNKLDANIQLSDSDNESEKLELRTFEEPLLTGHSIGLDYVELDSEKSFDYFRRSTTNLSLSASTKRFTMQTSSL